MVRLVTGVGLHYCQLLKRCSREFLLKNGAFTVEPILLFRIKTADNHADSTYNGSCMNSQGPRFLLFRLFNHRQKRKVL